MKHQTRSTSRSGLERGALLILLGLFGFALPIGLGSSSADAQAPRRSGNAAEPETYQLGLISGNRVNVRVGPSTNHYRIFSLDLDSPLIVTKTMGEWIQTMMPAHTTCWMNSQYLDVVNLNPDRSAKVLGTAVNVRPAPNTNYSVIGQVGPRSSVFPTGRKTTDGTWTEILAPREARVYVHTDYVKLGRVLSAGEVARIWPTLVPPGVVAPPRSGDVGGATPRPSSGEVVTGNPGRAGVDDVNDRDRPEPKRLVLPEVVSTRLKMIYAELEAELAKDPEAWRFEGFQKQLSEIQRTSEDAGEARLAQLWFEYIDTELVPIQRAIAENEPKRNDPEGPNVENDPKIPPKPKSPDQYLAKGWVVGMGKNSKVGGTHKLMKGNRLLFYLQSDTVDLDRLMYKRIGVQGTIQDTPTTVGARLIKVTGFKVLSD